MADEQEQILNIRVNINEAERAIIQYQDQITTLKGKLDELSKAQEQGAITNDEYRAAVIETTQTINAYNGEIRILNREIQANIKAGEKQDGSIKQLRDNLSALTKEYDRLSQSERESGQRGKELREAINATTSQIKEAEEATQRYYRNVGNYENAIKNTLGTQSKWFQQLQMIRDAMSGGVANGIKMAGAAVADFGKQLLALLVNPIVATIAAIAAAFMALKEGIASSEENTRAFNVILAPFKRALEAVLNVIQELTGYILDAVQGAEALAMGLSHLAERLPVVGKYFREVNVAIEDNIRLEKERQAIEDEARRAQELSAKTARDVAILRAAAAKTDDPEKRAKFLRTAIALEKQDMENQVSIAKRRLEVAEADAKKTQNDEATNDKIAQLRADVYAKEAAYYNGTLRMQRQLVSTEKEIHKERTEIRKESVKDTQESLKAEIAAIRESEDALFALIKDKYQRELEVQRAAFDRRIADLQMRLATEKNLTAEAQTAINTTIIALTQQRNNVLLQMEESHQTEMIARAVKAEEERLQLIIETTKKGSEEQFNARMALLQQQQDAATMEIEQSELTEEQKQERLSLIAQSYEQQRTQLRIAANQEELAALQKDFEERIAQESANAVAQQELRVEQKRQELEALHQVEGESEQEFAQRKLEIQKQYNEENKKLVEQNNKVEQSRLQVAQAVFGGLTSIMDAFGDDNKAAAVASKVLALAEVAINTGKAISAGVASAMATPFPGNIAAVATTIATVMANITTAIKTINSAKFADGGVAEGGGNVSGTGTSKSDSIAAQLSNGESVMTAAATAMFAPMLSTMNQIGGGVPIQPTATIYTSQSGEGDGMEMMASALANAIREMPAPIVSVEEINDVSTRVNVIESMAEAPVTQ